MSDSPSPRLRWLARGYGEPVVLLHGLLGEMDHWDGVLDALAPDFHVMAPELPLFDLALPDPSIPALADHVRRLFDALGIDRAVVGGTSLGGQIAILLASACPERVSALVLSGASGLLEPGATRSVPHRPTAAYVRERMEEVFYDPSLVTPLWVEAVRRLVTARGPARRLLQIARSGRRHRVEPLLPRLAVPTLLLWGKEDRITPPEVAERFHALLPHADLVYLPNCGHAPMLEQPDAFSAVLHEWLMDTWPARRRREAAPAGGR